MKFILDGRLGLVTVLCCVSMLHIQQIHGFKLNGVVRKGVAPVFDNRLDGCYHNGTVYGDGSMVPTVEPCLQCKCRDRNLVCSLRVCSEQPVPPPRGCVLVQKRGICCAYITCSRYHAINEVASRRRGDSTHTITRRRSPSGTSVGQAPMQIGGGYSGNALFRGIENEHDAVEGNAELCVFNGTIYKSGSAMTTSSLCSYCYCIGGRQKCVQPKCLLASPGCEPVYSDSTCCPIRYDCDAKNAGAAKPSYVHHSNKHYLRTKFRTQRSRGCLVGTHFYPEGQQLPLDPKVPCDMCFCIRGARKCTPKKCAPAIRNCRPMIPEGQCCPSSYECDHTEKIPNKSRQFDLFSLIFGDEFDNQTALESDSPVQHHSTQNPVHLSTQSSSSTKSDSLLAAIEAGLKYIDTNDKKVGSLLDDRVKNASNQTRPLPAASSERPILASPTTEKEYSFLDIFLGDDDEDEDLVVETNENGSSGQTVYNPIASKVGENQIQGNLYNAGNVVKQASSVVGVEQRTTISASTILSEGSDSTLTTSKEVTDTAESTLSDLFAQTTEYDQTTTTLDETSVTSEITTEEDSTIVLDSTTNNEESTPQSSDLITEVVSTTELSTPTSNTDSTLSEPIAASSTLPEFTTNSDHPNATVDSSEPTEPVFRTNPNTGSVKHKPEVTTQTSVSSTNSFAEDLQELLSHSTRPKPNRTSSLRPKRPVRPQIYETMIRNPISNSTQIKGTTENIFSALFGGISNIFSETNDTSGNTNRYKIRINNQTNGSVKRTTSPPKRTTTTATTISPFAEVVDREHTKNDSVLEMYKPPVTTPPLLMNSNPSILESDLNYDYGEPTLPPSLPNLNIIPFLPTDAVKTNRNSEHFGYLHTNSTSYPLSNIHGEYDPSYSQQTYPKSADHSDEFSLSKESKSSPENNEFELFHVSAKISGDPPEQVFNHPNGDGYDIHSYPSITEPNSDNNDGLFPSFSKYGNKYQYETYHPVEHRVNDYDTIKSPGFGASGSDESYGIVTKFDQYETGFHDKHGFGGDDVEYKTSNPLFGADRNNQFSPPSETEGGFLPKAPLLEDQYFFETYHQTKPMATITTEFPDNVNSKDYLDVGSISNSLHTETPTEVYSPLTIKPNPVFEELFSAHSSIPLPEVDYDKDIISITTDSNYHSTSEYSSFSSSEPVSIQAVTKKIPIYTPNTYSTTSSTSSDSSDLLGDFFGFLFKDEDELESTKLGPQEVTIPPFKNITSFVSLHDILNMTNEKEEKNNQKTSASQMATATSTIKTSMAKTTTEPSKTGPPAKWEATVSSPDQTITKTATPSTTTTLKTETPPNLEILRDVLLNKLSSADLHPIHPVRHPIYQGSVPFLSPIFQAKPETIEAKQPSITEYNPIRSDLDLILPGLQISKDSHPFDQFNVNHMSNHQLQSMALPEYSTAPIRKDFLNEATVHSAQKFEGSAQIFTKPAPSVGLLKLAGCNIYGRMYRVGRIISELSSECLECRCTDVGVHCTPLDC